MCLTVLVQGCVVVSSKNAIKVDETPLNTFIGGEKGRHSKWIQPASRRAQGDALIWSGGGIPMCKHKHNAPEIVLMRLDCLHCSILVGASIDSHLFTKSTSSMQR